VATADQYFPDRPITDEYVLAADLMPIQTARNLDNMSQSQKLLLDTAWEVAGQRPGNMILCCSGL
jgi:hypothetical protein